MPLKDKSNIIYTTYNTLLKKYGPQGWWPVNGKYFPESEYPFEIIIGAILTQNTAWKNADTAISNLRENGYLNPENILHADIKTLGNLIRPSGYYNQKTLRLKDISRFFLNYLKNKKIPSRDELLKVNGVGYETADSILLYAYHIPIFVIDAYTKRIFKRIGIVKDGDSYKYIQNIFMNSLPNDVKLFNEYHALIVEHGKSVCKRDPLCKICILNKEGLCSYSNPAKDI